MGVHQKLPMWSRFIGFAAAMVTVMPLVTAAAGELVAPEALPESRLLSIEASVQYALTKNPQLIAIREEHGIAAAAVVIAKTYPFNPVYQASYQEAHGPAGSVDNPFVQQHQVTLEVELFHQRAYRQQAAFAALSRTDWEIAAQELMFAVNAIRAFDGFLYRRDKLALLGGVLKAQSARYRSS